MKETKITDVEVMETLNREFSLADIYEVYKGILAYNMGWSFIDETREKILCKAIEFYMDRDYIRGFLPEEVLDYAIDLEARLVKEK